MPRITEEIGLRKPPHFIILRTRFVRIPMKTWRAFLGRLAEKRTGQSAIDATGFDHDQPSRHYADRTSYPVSSPVSHCSG